MIRFLQSTAAAFVLLASIAGGPVRAADDPAGNWLTQMGEAHINIVKCGKAAMCGMVAWLRDAIDVKTGQPPVDSQNPDPAKRSRKILGIRIFSMEMDANGTYAGDIYNSDDGKMYKGRLVPHGDDELEVQGCDANNLCGFETWSRVKTDGAAPAAIQNKK
jgi:uncharacterized protein (DUF2147 family)